MTTGDNAIIPSLGIAKNWRVCFELSISGKCYIRSWGVYVNQEQTEIGEHLLADEITHQFRFWQEVDPKAVGGVGPRSRLVADLVTTDTLYPIHYHITADGQQVDFRFHDGHADVRMPDGSDLTCDTKGAQFLLAGNMMPQLDLIQRQIRIRDALPYQGAFFSPEAMQVVSYSLDPGGEGLNSNLDETLLSDEDGSLREVLLSRDGFKIERVMRPLPRWRLGRKKHKKPFIYPGPPKNLPVRVIDLQVPGPVVPLGASLVLPTDVEPVAAVLFVAGSGGHDRHGITRGMDLGYHQILDRAAAHGIVSLRYDKRGCGDTKLGEDILEFGFDAVIADAEAALATLAARPEVRNLPLFIVGHSQGGLVALDLFPRHPEVHGVALLSTAARGLDEILIEQTKTQAEELDLPHDSLQRSLDDLETLFRCVREVQDWREDTVPAKVLVHRRAQKWYREILRRDPLELVREIAPRPVLVVHGGEDTQVPPGDAERLCGAAKESGAQVTCRILPGLDHLFKRPVQGQRFAAYTDRRRRVSRQQIDVLITWLTQTAQQERGPSSQT